MSEELRFKYLEELERSEALDLAADGPREKKRRRRYAEDVDPGDGAERTPKKRKKRRVSPDDARDARGTESRRVKKKKAAGQNSKKKKKRPADPESDVRSLDVPESFDGSSFVGNRWMDESPYDQPYDDGHASRRDAAQGRRRKKKRTHTEGRSASESSQARRRRKGGDAPGRVTDWDEFIRETEKLEASDRLQEEREARRRSRANAARRREAEAKRKRALIIRSAMGITALVLIIISVRIILTAVNSDRTPSGGNGAAGGTTGITSNISEEGTVAVPATDVVNVDSAQQLTTIFADWEYEPSDQDVMPEGDIMQVTDTFYPHDVMKRDLYFLRERYPDIITILRFGYTADGRDLLDVVIGDETAQKDVIIQYSIHAREYVNTVLGMKQIEELVKGIQNGTQYNGVAYADLLQGVRLHLIPMMNPDGVMISLFGFDAIGNKELRNGLYECWQSDIQLGKGDQDLASYYKRWKANARCVDLNRNFDCGWESTVGTTQPSCSRYKGEAPESEAETKALIALKDAINCVGQIAYHSEGELVYWDYGSKGDLHAVDEQLTDLVCGLTGYKKESTLSSKQEAAGCSDYFILNCGIPAITIETGTGECPIYIDQWEKIWNQNSQILPAIAQFFAQR